MPDAYNRPEAEVRKTNYQNATCAVKSGRMLANKSSHMMGCAHEIRAVASTCLRERGSRDIPGNVFASFLIRRVH